jgi:hypothetical protein
MKNVWSLNLKGPFKDEAAFKAAVLKEWRRDAPWFTRIEIENEEKEPGMPDVLSISNKLPAFLTEFKISDGNGVIEFQKTQPHFYRLHEELLIDILAWDTRKERVVSVSPREVTRAKKLRIKLSEVVDNDD